MKWQHGLMAVGLVAGVWLAFFSDREPDADIAQALVRPAAVNNTGASSTPALAQVQRSTNLPGAAVAAGKRTEKNERPIAILAIIPRKTLIAVGHVGLDGKKLGNAAPVFGVQSWMPPPPPPVDPKTLPPPPPPTAPPLTLSFLGKKFEDGVWEVYLAQGDESITVRNQSVINGTYRVDAITPAAVILTYLPLNQVQRLNIRGAR